MNEDIRKISKQKNSKTFDVVTIRELSDEFTNNIVEEERNLKPLPITAYKC